MKRTSHDQRVSVRELAALLRVSTDTISTGLPERRAPRNLHTLLDVRGAIPAFIHISDGKLHDVNGLGLLIPEPGACYVMDRGYLEFERLYRLHQAGSFFVTRAKSNFKCKRLYSRPVDRSTGLLCDQDVALTVFYSQQSYPAQLRRILFFKWIKQHLRIKRFFGISENAVKTPVWIAVSVYVLIAIIRKRLDLDMSLHSLLPILSVTPFEKVLSLQLLTDTEPPTDLLVDGNQLTLL